MDSQRIVEIIDAHIFKQTKKHLDKIQLDILKSAFNGQKYSELATHYDVTEGHIRDKASELWKMLSDVLGEEIKKSTVRSVVETFIIDNTSNKFVNSGEVTNVTFCPNYQGFPNSNEIKNKNSVTKENFDILIEEKLKETKLEIVPKLIKLGLTTEQITYALDLELDLILTTLKEL
jgi:hypothetical protein